MFNSKHLKVLINHFLTITFS